MSNEEAIDTSRAILMEGETCVVLAPQHSMLLACCCCANWSGLVTVTSGSSWRKSSTSVSTRAPEITSAAASWRSQALGTERAVESTLAGLRVKPGRTRPGKRSWAVASFPRTSRRIILLETVSNTVVSCAVYPVEGNYNMSSLVSRRVQAIVVVHLGVVALLTDLVVSCFC